jgi:putative acetyltransferase
MLRQRTAWWAARGSVDQYRIAAARSNRLRLVANNALARGFAFTTASNEACGDAAVRPQRKCGNEGLHTPGSRTHPPASRRLQLFRFLHSCSGCFRVERLPGGSCTHRKASPCHGAHPTQTPHSLAISFHSNKERTSGVGHYLGLASDRKMNRNIRKARNSDYAATRKLVEDAFGTEGIETAEFLDALRADTCILGEWLAEDWTGAIGHIVFSRVWLECCDDLSRQNATMLTPLAVRPDRQRVGIGMQLMNFALEELEAQGETLFFVLGHPSYYPRAGFRAVSENEVESPWPGEPAFMIRTPAARLGRLILPSVIADAH